MSAPSRVALRGGTLAGDGADSSTGRMKTILPEAETGGRRLFTLSPRRWRGCYSGVLFMSRRAAPVGALLIVLPPGQLAAQPPSGTELFESKIRPVLSSRCYACHSSTLPAPKGDLVLDTRAGLLKGGRLGPAVVPGKPADSKLLEALKYANPHLQRPPSGRLTDAIIDDFERWIAAGAPDPRADTAVAAAG